MRSELDHYPAPCGLDAGRVADTVLNMVKKHAAPEPGSTPKGEETRRRILDAALDLFRERGFERTTMRDVAKAAGVASGAAYYYFESKETLVLAFYLRTAEEMRDVLPKELAATKDLRRRLGRIVHLKHEQLAPHRRFLGVLFRTAADPESPLSPFGDATRALREESVAWFRQALDGSTTRVPKDLAPHLPRLLWMVQMGLLLFWIHDRSPGQRRTRRLADGVLDLVVRLLQLSSLPLMGAVRRPMVALLDDLREQD